MWKLSIPEGFPAVVLCNRWDDAWVFRKFISSDPHPDTLIWHSFWHIIWKYIFWYSFWHILWHCIWHSFWHLSWHSFWHYTWTWHLFWHSIWHEYTGLLHSIRSWQKEKSERRRRWGQVGGAGVGGSRRREEGEGVAPLLKSSWHLETLTWQVGKHRGNKEGKQHQAFDYEQNCDFMLRELMLLYTSLYIHELGHWSAARSKSRCGHGRNGPGGHPFEDCDVAILFARETWHVSSRDGQQTLGTQQHATSYYPYSRRPWVQHVLLDQAMPVSACQCLCLDVIVSQQVFDLVSIAICFGSHLWPTSLLCFSVLWCIYIYTYVYNSVCVSLLHPFVVVVFFARLFSDNMGLVHLVL